MTTLHACYQTLLRRGMPRIEHFTYADHGEEIGCCPTLNERFIPDAVALDLVSMHAVRWASTLRRESGPRIYKPTIHISYYEHDDDLCFTLTGIKQDPDTIVFEGSFSGDSFADMLLDAIIAATTYLEPPTRS